MKLNKDTHFKRNDLGFQNLFNFQWWAICVVDQRHCLSRVVHERATYTALARVRRRRVGVMRMLV